jgi:hypothetical protein
VIYGPQNLPVGHLAAAFSALVDAFFRLADMTSQDQTRFKRHSLEPPRERLLVFGELLPATPAGSPLALPAKLAAGRA